MGKSEKAECEEILFRPQTAIMAITDERQKWKLVQLNRVLVRSPRQKNGRERLSKDVNFTLRQFRRCVTEELK